MDFIESISVLLSALVAAGSLFLAAWTYRASEKAKNIERWQQVVMASLLQRAPDREFSFEELTSAFRSEASAFDDEKLTKRELSAANIRRVIMSLRSQGIVEQVGADQFRCRIVRDDFPDLSGEVKSFVGEAMAQVMGQPGRSLGEVFEQIAADQAAKITLASQLLGFIADHPFAYSESDVLLKFSSQSGAKTDDVRPLLLKSLAQGLIAVNAEQKLGPGHMAKDFLKVEGVDL